MGTPQSVRSTFARFDFIRVPLPAARTTAKIGGEVPPSDMGLGKLPPRWRAGAAGFEPAIPGPKPGALPLGYAPVSLRARAAAIIPERPRTVRIGALRSRELRARRQRRRRLQIPFSRSPRLPL